MENGSYMKNVNTVKYLGDKFNKSGNIKDTIEIEHQRDLVLPLKY